MGSAPVIVIVEDEAVLRASMVRGVRRIPGVDVLDAGTVKDAVEIIEAFEPSLVVTDIDLPDGSGIELVARLERRARRVPVIIVSAYVGSYRDRLPARPGLDVRDKPLAIDELRALIKRRLGIEGGAASDESSMPFSPADFVQLACMGRRSVMINVFQRGKPVGRIVVNDGELWGAADARDTGQAALRRLLFAPEVTVGARSLARGKAGARTIDGNWQNILLEAARVADEAGTTAAVDDVELNWGDTFDDTPTPPERPVPPAPALAADVASQRRFRQLVDEGVEALLRRRYNDAFRAFSAADGIRPGDPSVGANLIRLRDMGFAE